jgi:CHAT domain-containing protein
MLFSYCKTHSWIRTLTLFMLGVLTSILCILSPGLIATASPDEQATTAYGNQDYITAAKGFEQAAKAYQTSNAPLQQAISLGNLSLSYQQLGQWEQADVAIIESIKILNTLSATPPRSLALAAALEIQGGLNLTRGQTEKALIALDQATKLYQPMQKPDRLLASQTKQAQALQQMGAIRRAIIGLQAALSLPEPASPKFDPAISNITATPETVSALRLYGELLQASGNLPAAQTVLSYSLTLAQTLKRPADIARTQIQLGDLDRSLLKPEAAIAYYQQAAATPIVALHREANLHQLDVLVKQQDWKAAESMAQSLLTEVASSMSRTSIEQSIRLAQLIAQNPTIAPAIQSQITQTLKDTLPQVQALGDRRLESYILGSLGGLAEQQQQWTGAAKFTRQALQLVKPLNTPDTTYRWQWQLGRILNAQGQREAATQAYQASIADIKQLRNDLNASSLDAQFSFRNVVEPIHRQLVELLLKPSDQSKNSQANLFKARQAIEGLQSAELDNFFRGACLTEATIELEKIDPQAVIIYPILLDQQLAIITSLPPIDKTSQREFRYHTTRLDRAQVETSVKQFRQYLTSPQDNNLDDILLPELQKMYDWLLRDAIADLADRPVKTLVFVMDGALRNLPVAALHDGKQFLIEKYSVAISPGLQLSRSGTAAISSSQNKPRILAAGIADSHFEYDPLNFVKQELANIQQLQFPNVTLLNQAFTSQALQRNSAESPFKIVHLATHGEFSGNADKTFIVAWDKKITVNELSDLLKNTELSRTQSLDLLILSACQTAEGDDRAALGLAGMAVRSGARSTIATLWTVDDQAAGQLMREFYTQIAKVGDDRASKAEALRLAQLAILKDPTYKGHPKYWAAYTLVGDWTWQS